MRKIGFLLLPEFSLLGLAAAIEPLFIANWLAQRPVFAWATLSVDGKPVRASNGSASAANTDLKAVDFDSVFVLASFDPAAAARQVEALRWLKRMARAGAELGGIENGSWVLARAGLLNGHEVAVHWDNLAGFQEAFPECRASAQLYRRGANRLSCAGASAIFDLMVAFIGWHGEADLAAEVADHLLLTRVRAPNAGQRQANETAESGDAVIAKVVQLMAAHLEEPLSCRELARRVGLSLRQVERRFAQELGLSVLQHYRNIRVAKAHQLLQQTALSVIDVAVACGFSSPEYFSRVYRRQFACLPSRDRQQSTSAPVLRHRKKPRDFAADRH